MNNFAARSLSTNSARALTSTINGQEYHESSSAWMKMLAGVAAAGTLASGILDDRKAECCGIVGVIGTTDHDAR